MAEGTVDRAALVEELTPAWLDGLSGAEREEAERLLGEVVEDWAREAESTPDPDAVLAIQRRELEQRAAGDGPEARLRVLRSRALERRVDRLNTATLALGKAILAGTVDDEDARSRGREFLEKAQSLAAELDGMGSAASDPVRRELGEAVMDALYAVERKAMSPRLAREGSGGPPDIRP